MEQEKKNAPVVLDEEELEGVSGGRDQDDANGYADEILAGYPDTSEAFDAAGDEGVVIVREGQP